MKGQCNRAVAYYKAAYASERDHPEKSYRLVMHRFLDESQNFVWNAKIVQCKYLHARYQKYAKYSTSLIETRVVRSNLELFSFFASASRAELAWFDAWLSRCGLHLSLLWRWSMRVGSLSRCWPRRRWIVLLLRQFLCLRDFLSCVSARHGRRCRSFSRDSR